MGYLPTVTNDGDKLTIKILWNFPKIHLKNRVGSGYRKAIKE